ncbi:MAG TPA: zf-HC2 domain-containing protein, partial [Vicinamibacterales bacterium]|nr:zf-HC2 domain-containing protein [Vicinamibacterales bacterium]
MNTHLTEDELILHYYGETEAADEARVESHLASCAECRFANQQLRQVMTLVDSAAPVEAPPGFERVAWARLEPELDRNKTSWKAFFGFPQWALAGGVAALVFAAFIAGRVSITDPAPASTMAGTAHIDSGRVLQAEVGDHLDRTQMMLIELANADTDHADVLAGEQNRAVDLVAANRLIRQSAEQSGDMVIA